MHSPHAHTSSPSAPGSRRVSLPVSLPAEDTFESYRLVERIGCGGVGEVYVAEHTRLGRRVALKLLRPEFASCPDSVARLVQEAQAVNRIRHPNIVDITHLGMRDDGKPFIIMELLDGLPLNRWVIAFFGQTERIMRVYLQICDALEAAHAIGIVHRDLKPDNILVVAQQDELGRVEYQAKVLDFGMAKLLEREGEEYDFRTTEGRILGTPAYMAPEQAGGLGVDERSDIYSLGAIMYEMSTGQPVFSGCWIGEIIAKQLSSDPIPARQTAGGLHIDPCFEEVIMRCLAKDPADRYASIAALRRDLQRLAGGEGWLTPPEVAAAVAAFDRARTEPLLRTVEVSDSQIEVGDTVPAVRPRQPRRRLASIVIALIIAAVGGVITGWYMSVAQPRDPSVEAARSEAAVVAPADNPTSDQIRPIAPPTPTVTPLVEEPSQEPVASTLRLFSSPPADVYFAGSSVAQCKTPCELSVPVDGPPVRQVLLTRDGYYPEFATIDLRDPRESIEIALRPRPRQH